MGISAEIMAGERIAIKLKEYFFKDEKWTPNIAMRVGGIMSQFKKITRKFYPDLEEIRFLNEIGNYSLQDIGDAFDGDAGKEASSCKGNQPNAIGALLEHSMGDS